MAELWLVSEGRRDVPVLRAILTQAMAAGIIVEGAGGDRAIAAVAEYVAQRGGTTAYVCDRDYRRREEVDAAFTDGKRCFYWRRHTIENYLLQPEVVAQALTRLRDQLSSSPRGAPRRAAALPTEREAIAGAFRQVARTLAAREAARMATWRLWEDLSSSAGRVQKRSLEVPLGSDAPVCREALLDEAERLRVSATETVASPHLTADAITSRFEQILAGVTTAEYLRDLRFLEEFNGHDLFDQFRVILQQQGIRLPADKLSGGLIDALRDLYRTTPGLFVPDDFRDLANGVRALAGLPMLP
jgi:hypothetical protein